MNDSYQPKKKSFWILILQKLGLYPTDEDRKISDMVSNSWKSLKVSRRGTITIDPAEVRASPEFQNDLKRAKEIVDGKYSQDQND